MALISYYCHQCQRNGRRSAESNTDSLDCLNCGSGFVEITGDEVVEAANPIEIEVRPFSFGGIPVHLGINDSDPESERLYLFHFKLMLKLIRLGRATEYFIRQMTLDFSSEANVGDEALFGEDALQHLMARLMRQSGL